MSQKIVSQAIEDVRILSQEASGRYFHQKYKEANEERENVRINIQDGEGKSQHENSAAALMSNQSSLEQNRDVGG